MSPIPPHAADPSRLTLARLLGDAVTVDDFLAHYWGQKPLLVRRGQPGFYQRVFSLADVDQLLFTGQFRPGEYRISRADEGIDLQYQEAIGRDEAPPFTDFYRAFAEGRSIVMHGLHLRWPAMTMVTRLLEHALACSVTTNVYLTPAGKQAYPLHYDTHDFFIFQLHGTKHWRMFEPGTKRSPIRALGKLSPEPFQPGAFTGDIHLEDGDLLYVPRGFPHEVIGLDTSSLHLTVGLHGITWHSLLTNALSSLAARSEKLRTFVPLKAGPTGSGIHDLDAAPEILRLVQEQLAPGDALKLWRDEHRAAINPVPDGHWLALDKAATIHDATRVVRRFGIAADVALQGAQAELRFLQEKVTLPAEQAEALRYVATTEVFTPGSIPQLTQAERTSLVRSLVAKGFLTLPDSQAPASTTPLMNRPAEATLVPDYHPLHNHGGDDRVQPMNDAPPAQETSATPQSSCGCGGNKGGGAPAVPPSLVYAIGRISARFPSVEIEKELFQAVKATETSKLTDSQVLYQVLSKNENAYLAREMCWVFTVRGVETYTIVPRSGLELTDLINSLNLEPGSGGTSVLIGMRNSVAMPASACGGLSLPMVVASKLYSFNLSDFIKELPLGDAKEAVGRELLGHITHLTDNVGDLDEHRAVNYLALRYPAIYNLVADQFNRDSALSGLQVSPTATRSQRRLVDVIFKFTGRKTDVREMYGVRVDVTGMFPFLVSPLHPVFSKDTVIG